MNEITNNQPTVVQGQPLDDWANSASNHTTNWQASSATGGDGKKRKSNLGCIISLLIVTIVAAVMIFTCPTAATHKEALTVVVASSVTKVINENSPDRGLISQSIHVLGNLLAKKTIDVAIDNMVTVDNYVVCSVGKVSYGGEDHIVSLGVFGHIFTTDQERVEEAARKYYLQAHQELEKTVEDAINNHIVDPIVDTFNGLLDDL